MSLHLALGIVIAVSIIGNRIFSVLAGLILRIPAAWLLPTLYIVDLIQIPLFYWLYENSATVLARLPGPLQRLFGKDWSTTTLNRWTASLGGLGVFFVAAFPAMGGGMWSAVFVAYGLRLKKVWSYIIMALASLLSYLTLYWVLDTLVRTVRYFCFR
jgi:hypothetical protein